MSEKLLIFRMTHVDNLEFILKNGMWAMSSEVQDPNFVSIGNLDVIGKRKDYPVKIVPPGGLLGEYVPFYFDGHSPMLYNIITGWKGMKKYAQRDIVYIVCNAYDIMESELEWCYTDGHAKVAITTFYNSKQDLVKLDWPKIRSTQWTPVPEDQDRMRKKMAEFLVRRHVPSDRIRSIVVHSAESKQKVEELMTALAMFLPVHIDTENRLYYKDYD